MSFIKRDSANGLNFDDITFAINMKSHFLSGNNQTVEKVQNHQIYKIADGSAVFCHPKTRPKHFGNRKKVVHSHTMSINGNLTWN